MAFSARREFFAFAATLGAIMAGFFAESLFGGRILSPADVLFATGSFAEVQGPGYEPANRLLIDPVLQFQPWLEFNRSMLRAGRLPLWNPLVGCGAPHLANGQSAVFDPFHLIAYLGDLPRALGWMAAARLWFAGVGMFLLARVWGFGVWGRWFSGLTFPFCGFVVAWLLFPVTNVAVWMPWAFLATERVFERRSARRVGGLAIAVAGTLLGGHVQTSAHVLLAIGAYASWKAWTGDSGVKRLMTWSLGISLGMAIASIEIVPLASYLSRSPVWGDRERERASSWTMVKPRALDAACTALPYLFGSQRRGHPNLAKAFGVYNLNESAGGFAGLATLIWLAPSAWMARRGRPLVAFLSALTAFGLLAAFRFPPVDNLLRALPVLGVTDNRRLTLWVGFGLVTLGGIGLDRLADVRLSRAWVGWGWTWAVVSLGLLAAAGAVGRFTPAIRARAIQHYASASERTPGADREVYLARAERQARDMIEFVPRYLGLAAAQGFVLASLLWAVRRERIGIDFARGALLVLTMFDLFGFGFGLNPAIDPADDRPVPAVVEALRREVGNTGRTVGLGAELAPNTLMRYGLADARNYDSVELSRNLEWLEPLYDPSVDAKTSRREISWGRVLEGRERLRQSSVKAIVGPTPPPPEIGRVRRIGRVWVATLDAEPMIEVEGEASSSVLANDPGRIILTTESRGASKLIIRETFDPGWRAEIDGIPLEVEPHLGTFLALQVPSGLHHIVMRYDPTEVRIAVIVSIFGLIATVFTLTDFAPFRFTRIVLRRLGRTQAIGLESDS